MVPRRYIHHVTSYLREGKHESLAAAPALERLGEPADIADLVAFLAGPGRGINGHVLSANGGLI